MIVRQAIRDDSEQMVAVLNEIIAVGGTTAHQRPFDGARMTAHYIEPSNLISCNVAEVDQTIIGFQSLNWATNPDDPLPDRWAIIASFVSMRASGKGVGQLLFNATKEAAKLANVNTIDATIRADNTPGLRYYTGLGFSDYDRLVDIPLADGTCVDRIRKRFDLL